MAKNEGKKVKLVRDKLYINGKPHVSPDTKPNGTEYRDVLLRQAQQNSYRNKTVNERPFKRSRQESGNNDAIYEATMQLFSKCLLVGDFNARTGSEDDFIFVPDSESHVVDIENIQINAVCNLDQYDFSRKRNSRDKNKKSAGKKSEHRKNKPWFEHDCKAARSEFRKMKRNKNKSPFHRALVLDAEKRYKNTMNKAHKKYRSDFRKKMDDLKQKDGKEFWRLLNGNKSTARKIDFDKLVSYFKELNSDLRDDTENQQI
ncbi:unnamed protein product [Mytilus edulis]|uniref:Endonuclease/exonuclease/phosphatase domain-containing protein n=1 Tax=Mytilus edulis TaxID=6550 RepID=A0A8S3VSL4_MYTED|nr:unnamed protein product [Mytilus edulis]